MAEQFTMHAEMNELKSSAELVKLEVLGSLSALGENPNWTGPISLAKRFETGELDAASVETKIASIPRFITQTTAGAEVRCIDERPVAGYSEPAQYPDMLARPLGPQVPGGTPAAALAMRAVEFSEPNTAVKLEDDIDKVVEIYKSKDPEFEIGGHIDDSGNPHKTGCGAIDNLPAILERITNPKATGEIRAMVAHITDQDYDPMIFNMVIGNLVAIQGTADTYLSKDSEGHYGYNHKAIAKVKQHSPKGVEKLVGPHNGVAVNINYKPGTTFHRDEFSRENDHQVQVFNYDYWRSQQLAEALYGDSEFKRRQFLITRAIYAVGTAMVLTDGTLALTETR